AIAPDKRHACDEQDQPAAKGDGGDYSGQADAKDQRHGQRKQGERGLHDLSEASADTGRVLDLRQLPWISVFEKQAVEIRAIDVGKIEIGRTLLHEVGRLRP